MAAAKVSVSMLLTQRVHFESGTVMEEVIEIMVSSLNICTVEYLQAMWDYRNRGALFCKWAVALKSSMISMQIKLLMNLPVSKLLSAAYELAQDVHILNARRYGDEMMLNQSYSHLQLCSMDKEFQPQNCDPFKLKSYRYSSTITFFILVV
jgi:hypothetical protein